MKVKCYMLGHYISGSYMVFVIALTLVTEFAKQKAAASAFLVSSQLPQTETQALEGTSTPAARHMERFSWLDLAHSIFVTFEAHYSFSDRANVRRNSPAVLVNTRQSPCLNIADSRKLVDTQVSQAILLMRDMFTSQVAHPISRKVFKKWNKPVRTHGVKVKTCTRDFILAPTAASRTTATTSSRGARARPHNPAQNISPAPGARQRPPPARDFILAPAAVRRRPVPSAEVPPCVDDHPPPARDFILAPAAVRRRPVPSAEVPPCVDDRPPPARDFILAPAAVRQRPVPSAEVPPCVDDSFVSCERSSSPAATISSISTVSDLSSTPNSSPLELPVQSEVTSGSLQGVEPNTTSLTVFDFMDLSDLEDSAVIASDASVTERNAVHRVTSGSSGVNPPSFTTSVVRVIPIPRAQYSDAIGQFGLGAFHPLLDGRGQRLVGDDIPPSYTDSVAAGREYVYTVTRSNLSP
ncbi:hypothetical protein F4604DRAFT_1680526 [Suillus subluteus]|nr:hypothetical protein F4604DRAFT_1680526 [Suillus subluteus]